GRPTPWVRVRLLDEDLNEVPRGEPGEICVQGPLVMAGYWKKPAETDEALRGGWLHTGDIAREDQRGFYTIVDRKMDEIVSGGFTGCARSASRARRAASAPPPAPGWRRGGRGSSASTRATRR